MLQDDHVQIYEKEIRAAKRLTRIVKGSQKIMWLFYGVFLILVLSSSFLIHSDVVQSLAPNFIGSIHSNPNRMTYGILLLVLVISVSSWIFSFAYKSVLSKEQNTLSRLMKYLFPDMNYSSKDQVSREHVAESHLFTMDEATQAYTYGTLMNASDERQLAISDIGLIEEKTEKKIVDTLIRIPGINFIVILYQFVLKNIFSKKRAENVYYSFRGLFTSFVLGKNIESSFMLVPNNLGTDPFSNMIKEIIKQRGYDEYVQLEDERFNKVYTVYADDQVHARYVLSSVFMEELTELYNQIAMPITMRMAGNHMYIAMYYPDGFFSFADNKKHTSHILEFQEVVKALQVFVDKNSLSLVSKA